MVMELFGPLKGLRFGSHFWTNFGPVFRPGTKIGTQRTCSVIKIVRFLTAVEIKILGPSRKAPGAPPVAGLGSSAARDKKIVTN